MTGTGFILDVPFLAFLFRCEEISQLKIRPVTFQMGMFRHRVKLIVVTLLRG